LAIIQNDSDSSEDDVEELKSYTNLEPAAIEEDDSSTDSTHARENDEKENVDCETETRNVKPRRKRARNVPRDLFVIRNYFLFPFYCILHLLLQTLFLLGMCRV
jgi:hypothetical protein